MLLKEVLCPQDRTTQGAKIWGCTTGQVEGKFQRIFKVFLGVHVQAVHPTFRRPWLYSYHQIQNNV